MKRNIKVREILGNSCNCEDAIFLKDKIMNDLSKGIVLDFDGYERVPSTFLTCLFTDLIEKLGREYIYEQINVKNISNISDYSRVVLGTAFN